MKLSKFKIKTLDILHVGTYNMYVPVLKTI